ncbi:Lar family restriction alleviation protein [Agrobacterium rosae]|uniref:Lar family restriction alleviation protein n=1 Tax=Agrobacterium rosae TaxID=1972867 RepID=UPI003BA08FCE
MSQLLLQPCPFCGGDPKIMHCGAGTYMIQCLGCKATTDDGGETRVSANWNRRSPAVSPSQGWHDEEKLTPEAAWTYLCETPDITSPEEYPDHALITFEQLRDYMERAIPIEASDSTKEAEASFTEYFVRNYPGPDTVIYDPRWHAPKIFRAAAYALKNANWRPIADADLSVTTEFKINPELAIRNSDPFWVRDEDGRVFEAVWSVGKTSYWWDLEGESPVDPIEFMPHPLDPRYQSKGGAA